MAKSYYTVAQKRGWVTALLLASQLGAIQRSKGETKQGITLTRDARHVLLKAQGKIELERIKERNKERARKRDTFNAVVSKNDSRFTKEEKQSKGTYLVRVRNCFTGVVRTVKAKALSETHARANVRRVLETFETLA